MMQANKVRRTVMGRNIVFALAGITALVGMYLWATSGSQRSMEPVISAAPANSPAQTITQADLDADGDSTDELIGAGDTSTIGPSPGQSSLAAEYFDSRDLRAFIDSHLAGAHDGDAVDQYYVFKALAECELYAFARSRTTKDDWLTASNAAPPERRDEIALSFDRCKGFLGQPDSVLEGYYGDDAHRHQQNWEWLRLAADGGHPVAQSLYPLRLLTQKEDINDAEQKAVALLNAAALSGDAEALRNISSYFAGVDGVEHAAWVIVACAKGYECSPQSRIARELCALPRSCTRVETAQEILRANLGEYDYALASARATDLNAAIEIGDVTTLRLDALRSFGD